jgi:hypothetical protein
MFRQPLINISLNRWAIATQSTRFHQILLLRNQRMRFPLCCDPYIYAPRNITVRSQNLIQFIFSAANADGESVYENLVYCFITEKCALDKQKLLLHKTSAKFIIIKELKLQITKCLLLPRARKCRQLSLKNPHQVPLT